MTTSAPTASIRRLRAGALLVVLLMCLAGSLPLFAGTASAATLSGEEQDYVARINALRASVGAGPLVVDDNLTDLSRAQTQRMADANKLFHTPDLAAGVTGDWENLGENVGMGSNSAVVFDAFVKSPHHYENLVNPTFTHVGVAVITVGNIQWTTHRFMTVRAPQPVFVPPAPQPAPAPVVELPAPAPAPVVVVPTPAPVVPAPAPKPAPVPTIPAPLPTTTIPAPVLPVVPEVVAPPAPVPTPADPARVDMMVVALHAC